MQELILQIQQEQYGAFFGNCHWHLYQGGDTQEGFQQFITAYFEFTEDHYPSAQLILGANRLSTIEVAMQGSYNKFFDGILLNASVNGQQYYTYLQFDFEKSLFMNDNGNPINQNDLAIFTDKLQTYLESFDSQNDVSVLSITYTPYIN